jgi:hypothetical protein
MVLVVLLLAPKEGSCSSSKALVTFQRTLVLRADQKLSAACGSGDGQGRDPHAEAVDVFVYRRWDVREVRTPL